MSEVATKTRKPNPKTAEWNRRVLAVLQSYHRSYGTMPSYTELGVRLGCVKSWVHTVIMRLASEGRVLFTPMGKIAPGPKFNEPLGGGK